MGYRFRLEALKRYRHFQEEACQKEFSEAQRFEKSETASLMNLIERRNRTEADMASSGGKKTTGPHLTMVSRYLERITKQIASQRDAVEKARQRSEEKRQLLVTAMQKRKTLEKLKEHGLQAYLQNLNLEEEKFINEMAINRHILKAK